MITTSTGAKLKFDGDRLDGLKDSEPSEWEGAVTRADIYKMHTYRDAIRESIQADRHWQRKQS